MAVSYMEILGGNGVSRPTLTLTRHTRDALAKYCELRWPLNRRRHVQREWGLSPDQARAVCEATASASTIDHIWKHKNGGWAVLLPVLGAVIGESLDQHLEAERKAHIERAQRLGALVDYLRPVGVDRPVDGAGNAPGASERRAAERRRARES